MNGITLKPNNGFYLFYEEPNWIAHQELRYVQNNGSYYVQLTPPLASGKTPEEALKLAHHAQQLCKSPPKQVESLTTPHS